MAFHAGCRVVAMSQGKGANMSKSKALTNLRPVRPMSKELEIAAAAEAFAGSVDTVAPAPPPPSPTPTPEPATDLKRLSVDVSRELRKRLKRQSLAEDRPLRNIAIDALEEYLAKHGSV